MYLCGHTPGSRSEDEKGIVAKKTQKTKKEYSRASCSPGIGHRSRIHCHLILALLTAGFFLAGEGGSGVGTFLVFEMGTCTAVLQIMHHTYH